MRIIAGFPVFGLGGKRRWTTLVAVVSSHSSDLGVDIGYIDLWSHEFFGLIEWVFSPRIESEKSSKQRRWRSLAGFKVEPP